MQEIVEYPVERDQNRPESFSRTRYLPDGAPVGREILKDSRREKGEGSYRKPYTNLPTEKDALLNAIRENIVLGKKCEVLKKAVDISAAEKLATLLVEYSEKINLEEVHPNIKTLPSKFYPTERGNST
ncbi:hypothetical protein M0Q50_08100 [bacterium]|jgi:hypothetical protein|nr:hypothetical protein [bacterium]